MEDDQEKRMEFINENIIEQGIDLEEITKFAESVGKNFDSLKIDELKGLIEQFKNKDNKEEPKKEEEKKEEPKKEEVKEEPKKEEPKKEEEKKEEPKKEEEENKEGEDKIIKKRKSNAKILIKENSEEKKEPEKNEQEIKKEEVKEEPKKEEPKKEEPKKEELKEEPKKEESENKGEKQENQAQPKNEIKDQKQTNDKTANQAQPQQPPKKEINTANLKKGLYFPEPIEFKTQTQQNNKLFELVKNKKPIQIKISEPKKESEGFIFSKTVYSYRVQCTELGSDVRRTFADFEWLRNQLNLRYPLRLTPVVVKENIIKQMGKNLMNENDENYESRKMRYLNKFIESILEKKILCTSPIFYEFLILDAKKLAKYKTILEKKTYELEVGLNNLITVKGEVKCKLEKETINNAEYIYGKSNSMAELYNKINENIDAAVLDFNNLYVHLRNISNLFKYLSKNINAYKYSNVDDMKESFNDLDKSFEKWSVSIYEQCLLFNIKIKENLNYMSTELSEMNNSFKKYRDYRYEYEEFYALIKKEKENLVQAHYNTEMKKEENKGKKIKDIKFDEKKFDDFFYNKNQLLIEEKKRLCTTIHYLLKDYDKLIKIHCKKMKDINEVIKKAVVIDFNKGNLCY
jgi:hypothetical protein